MKSLQLAGRRLPHRNSGHLLSVFRLQPEMWLFCDTQHEEGKIDDRRWNYRRSEKYPAVTVVLTGGEPSIWIDEQLIDRFAPGQANMWPSKPTAHDLAGIYRLGDLLPKQRGKTCHRPDGWSESCLWRTRYKYFELLRLNIFSSSLVLVITLLQQWTV